jgi:hypothetical protein
LVEEFFKRLKELERILKNKTFEIVDRMLEFSKNSPEQLVSALRIIEREEVLDDYWIRKEQETGFCPLDRPKKWRKECREKIRNKIEEKCVCVRREESIL